jgi:hypothetical protein
MSELSWAERRFWASVNKIVPALGYITGNVCVASMTANTWKSNGSSPTERARILEILFPKPKHKPDADYPSLFN